MANTSDAPTDSAESLGISRDAAGRPSAPLKRLAELLGVTVPAEKDDVIVSGLDTLDDAGPGDLTYLADPRYVDRIPVTKAAAVFVSRDLLDAAVEVLPEDGPVLLPVDNAADSADQVLALVAPTMSTPPAGVHPSAEIAESATVGANARIASGVVIGEHVVIGDNVVLHPSVQIADHCRVGDDCTLHAHVVLRDYTFVENRVIIHAGSVLGSDGFGYRWDGAKHVKVPQIGNVVVEDDVEIGSCTCIDRGKTRETRIGAGTKIDNLVQIGHNVQIGRHCILCANVGVAGSTTIGNGVILAGGVGLKDHIALGDGAQVAGASAVHADVPPGEQMFGMPAVPKQDFFRAQRSVRSVPRLLNRLEKLAKRVEELEQQVSSSDKTSS